MVVARPATSGSLLLAYSCAQLNVLSQVRSRCIIDKCCVNVPICNVCGPSVANVPNSPPLNSEKSHIEGGGVS